MEQRRRMGAKAPAGPSRAGRSLAVCAALLLALLPAVRPAHAQTPLSPIDADVEQIVARTRPSVVTVVVQRDLAPVRGEGPNAPRVHSRVGSGVAVAADEVLTTASVVLGANRVYVLTEGGLQSEATLVGLDPIYNVALLRTEGLQLPPMSFAARPAQLGDWVIAMGSSYRAEFTRSLGNVSNRFREPRMSLLQLTNDVYPGNSGGAAVNTRGELIGLVQGELGAPEAPGRSNPVEHRPSGMSFVIPSEDLQHVVRNLRLDGRAHLGYLGVSTRPASIESDTQPGLVVPLGALVESVQPGGPAARLGLRKGDLIVAFDDERVEYPEQLARWVAAAGPRVSVRLVWARDELRHEGSVALSESPSEIPSWMSIDLPAPAVHPPAAGGTTGQRIADIEEKLRRLRSELNQLRNPRDSTR